MYSLEGTNDHALRRTLYELLLKNPISQNPFIYVSANPINSVDYMGYMRCYRRCGIEAAFTCGAVGVGLGLVSGGLGAAAGVACSITYNELCKDECDPCNIKKHCHQRPGGCGSLDPRDYEEAMNAECCD